MNHQTNYHFNMFDSIRKVDTDVLLQYIIPLKSETKMSMSI